MNRTKIKNYAPRARREFIQAVTDRAAFFGLTAKKTEPIVQQGDLAIIGGRPFPKAVAGKRKRLEERIKRDGFEQTMEALAYTWFNRLVAIRYMELHGYLDHGYRVLSAQGATTDGANGSTGAPAKSTAQTPEILAHAEHLDLPGLDRQTVIELKLAGDKEAELYRMLLVAQCNALHAAMPFLFERIDDETELVLPENLLHSDSLIRKLVGEIDEQDWQEVEIIGWIYQFYISEKKDQVIGKVVKSEDIPAATQLFTPNWIVKYLVQNSLGRQWLEHHPDSPLKSQMEYYIEPAEQTPEVQAQLQEIIRKRATDQRGLNTDENTSSPSDPCSVRVPSVADLSLDPEKLTLLDPACGSGHILVEAYDLFKAIYQERGYNRREIPRLILEKNLYGLEIDDRAAQLASLALMMKARADDRRIFDRGVKPNVLAFQESKGLDAKEITEALNKPILKEELPPSGELFEEIADEKSPLFSRQNLAVKGDISQADVAQLVALFEHGKTFGSLIQVPEKLAEKLPAITQRLEDALAYSELFETAAARTLVPLVRLARVLVARHDAVVTNPPYMGQRYQNQNIKLFAANTFADTKSDLFAMFIERSFSLANSTGIVAIVAMHSWMFLSAYAKFRLRVLNEKTIFSLAHLGAGAFGEISGEVVQVAAFSMQNVHLNAFRPVFQRLVHGSEEVKRQSMVGQEHRYTRNRQCDLQEIPGAPIGYWIAPEVVALFRQGRFLKDVATPSNGIQTGDNDRFVRTWSEVDQRQVGTKWFPYAKGGTYRKWYGNNDHYVDWADNGKGIKEQRNCCVRGESYYFSGGITWSDITSGNLSCRLLPEGFLFDAAGPSAFVETHYSRLAVLALMNSIFYRELAKLLNPTMHFQAGNFRHLPFLPSVLETDLPALASRAVRISEHDWNSSESSWHFAGSPLIHAGAGAEKVCESFASWQDVCKRRHAEMLEIERASNALIVRLFKLPQQCFTELDENDITLHRPDREEDIKRLISYAVGCMMGRYSLDKPGLIYAHSGNEGFDPSQYVTFSADDDGLVPLLESDWGIADDAANRLAEFINVCWPGTSTTDNTDATDNQTPSDTPLSVPSVKSVVNKTSPYLEENLQFIAESLGPTRSEQPRDTIRRYLATGFFKHHLSMYKRRPIYWLFTSGKLRAFQCLVYLHRYNDGTLSRMRTEYVIPLQGKLAARADQLATEITAATSTSRRKKLEKERDKLIKQQVELQTFDEKLRHYADRRITLDLDDGVKVNYAKFGDLLAEVKAVTGAKA